MAATELFGSHTDRCLGSFSNGFLFSLISEALGGEMDLLIADGVVESEWD